MSYGGVPFPGGGGQQQYVNPNAGYSAPSQYPAQYGGQMPQMGMMPPSTQATAVATDPYANAKPGTIAYAKSEGPDGIATYTPVIAQETFYQTPSGPTRGVKWVTATSSQASAAGIPSGAITASNPAQLPQTAGMMPPISMPAGGFPPGSAVTAPGYPPGFGGEPYMGPPMTARDREKAAKRADKERRAAEKAARKEEKERKRHGGDREQHRSREWDRDPRDPYGITGGAGGADRQRRMSTGAGLGFERQRRMSGGGMLREDDLSRKLESLDTSFSSRRERRMSGGASGYAPSNVGGFRSRKNSMAEASGRDRKISGDYGQRPSFYPPAGAGIPGGGIPGGGYGAQGYGAGARSMPGSPVRPASAFPATGHHYYEDPPRGGPSPRPGGGHYSRSRHASPSMPPTHLPGGYGGPSYGRDPAPASAYPAYGAERTPHSVVSNLPPSNADSYALTRRAPSGAPNNAYPVSGRELNRAQPFTAFEEFFLVEDLAELMQPQPPPLPAALVPHDVMAEEWDRCMQGLISLATSVVQTGRGMESLLDLVTQWNTTFFLPRGVDIGVYKGDSRRSGPGDDDSDSDSSTSTSSSSSSSEEEYNYYAGRREQRAAKRAERKARHKERRRRRRERRRLAQRSISIRIRAVPIH